MRGLLLGLAASLAFASMASAEELIVVKSTDAAIKRGQAFSSGAHLELPAGRSVTLIRASGEVVVLNGRPHGVVVPGAAAGGGGDQDSWRLAALKALVAPPGAHRDFGATRGFCPDPQDMLTLSIIVRADQAGCTAGAQQAFDNYLNRQGQPAPSVR